MMLDDFFTNARMMDQRKVMNELGSFEVVYAPGQIFRAGFATDNTAEIRIALQQGAKVTGQLMTDMAVVLNVGDVVRRESDGSIWRVMSDSRDMTTPPPAQLRARVVNIQTEKVAVMDE